MHVHLFMYMLIVCDVFLHFIITMCNVFILSACVCCDLVFGDTGYNNAE
jgi:hypothetical protein